jgi:oxygen-independent coproporphyrinogen-3 oxidase
VQDALRWQPEEVFLYPLYLRPLTGLGKKERTFADQRPRLYRLGRDFLLAAGYEQRSMRMFRHTSARAHADEPAYTCQEDGMVGLGCGARSYTRGLHYSDEWATGAVGVKAIIAGWIERSDESFDQAWYGISLDAGEQRRRFIIQSLLHASGLSAPDYRARFGTQVMEDHPELREVIDLGLAENTSALHLTPRGFELSDCLGPWLYSDMVRERMREFDLR